MTGTRHHILPKFLLKGFASKIDGKKTFTWFYKKGEEAVERSTKDVSIEKHFYGRNGGVNLDSEITELEKELAISLNKARESPEGIINDRELVRLVVHITTRTKYLRNVLSEFVELSLNNLNKKLSKPSELKEFMLHGPSPIAEKIEPMIDEKFNDHSVNQALREILKPMLMCAVDQHIDSEMSQFQSLFNSCVNEAINVSNPAIKQGHIESLADALIPEERLQKYLSLQWFVIDSNIPLVLGDIGCLFKDHRNQYQLLINNDDLSEAFLPISSRKILVGSLSGEKPNINFRKFRKEYCKWSSEYFICSSFSSEINSLSSTIGEALEGKVKDESARAVKKFKNEFKRKSRLAQTKKN
jgi:hypothetical protein